MHFLEINNEIKQRNVGGNMSTYVLTSMFHNGFHGRVSELFRRMIVSRNGFAFVASEFEKQHETTDHYFTVFLNMFETCGIHFQDAYAVDGRMTRKEAQRAVEKADVVWLAGGDSPKQFRYLQSYGLDIVIKQHQGIIIGMSAGSINMAETAICTVSCGHDRQEIYKGLGCVKISVEPHIDPNNLSGEVTELSANHTIYGLCDESMIVCTDGTMEFVGDVYKIRDGHAERMAGTVKEKEYNEQN